MLVFKDFTKNFYAESSWTFLEEFQEEEGISNETVAGIPTGILEEILRGNYRECSNGVLEQLLEKPLIVFGKNIWMVLSSSTFLVYLLSNS